MSKRFHVRPNTRDIGHLTNEEIEKEYGVTFNDDGTVSDPIFNRKFETTGEWAAFLIEQEEMEYEEIEPEEMEYDEKTFS